MNNNKGQLLQDPFLNALRKEHIPVGILFTQELRSILATVELLAKIPLNQGALFFNNNDGLQAGSATV